MGLSSVFSTAITGLDASQTTIDVVGNNVANANTVGFKASEAVFATQFLQTLTLGSAPSENNGGTNPKQIGLGTQVAGITPDFTQGTLQISSSPSDLAIQGDGFFMVQGPSGEQLYTRNGKFQVNSQNQLVTANGGRLLGFSVDDNFQVQTTTLQPLTVPLGAAAVAKATQNVTLEGTLTPTGDVADTAAILQSSVLGTSALSAPTNTTAIGLSEVPDISATTLTGSAGGALNSGGTYSYKIVFANGTIGSQQDTEGTPSFSVGPLSLAVGETQITLANIPTGAGTDYSTRRIYRTTDGGATYQLVGEIPDTVTTGFTDNVADGALGAAIDDTRLTGNYSYYVTFANAVGGPGFGTESRPSQVIGPLNVVNGRIDLTTLPVDASGDWSVRRIYRNSAADSTTFNFVAEIPNNLANQKFTDNVSDATIAANAEIDLDGPRVQNNTLLTDVLRRTDNGYEQLFTAGTLSFTGRKGGRELGAKELVVDSNTTVLDLMNFMRDSLGIQTPPGPDPTNPIPGDISGLSAGSALTADGAIRFVGNNGVDNSLDIGLSGLQLTDGTGVHQVDLQFNTTQQAKGQSAVADFIAYDSLGIPVNVRVTSVLQSRSGTTTTYRWFANSNDNDPLSGVDITVGTGLVTFDGEGKFLSTTDATVSIDRAHVPSAKPLELELDFSQMSGLASNKASMAATRQDGFPPGKLTSFIIGEDGTIRGVFDNGTERDLGQIRLARFANAQGLEQHGQNLYAAGVTSGLPVQGNPGEQGIGSIVAGAVELSNTDIGANLIDLITASTMYRGNTRVITAAQQLLEELLNLRR